MPDFHIERKYRGKIVAGLDEVGRGCLAGPVVAAVVIFPEGIDTLPLIDDSKKLTSKERQNAITIIMQHAIDVRIGMADVQEVDALNPLGATKLAMTRALSMLTIQPDVLLIDGDDRQRLEDSRLQKFIKKGDSQSLSIAAASIIAKEFRDLIMVRAHNEYPEYDWENNKGYGTKKHRNALETYGYTYWHRLSFEPLVSHLNTWNNRMEG